jgi:hypothetical protein
MDDEIVPQEGAEAPVEPQSPPTPGPGSEGAPVEDKYGTLLSRYQRAGLDLEGSDPEQLAKAHALHKQVGEGPIYTDQQLPNLFQQYLFRLSQDPNGQALLRQLSGQQQAAASPDSEGMPDDGMTRRLQMMEQQLARQQWMIQQLEQSRAAMTQDQETRKQAEELRGHLASAVQSVPGAGEYKDMSDEFWRDIAAGVIPDHALTAAGVKGWVKKFVERRQAMSPAPRPKRAPTGGQRGGKAQNVKLEDMSLDDITDFIAEQAGLP